MADTRRRHRSMASCQSFQTTLRQFVEGQKLTLHQPHIRLLAATSRLTRVFVRLSWRNSLAFKVSRHAKRGQLWDHRNSATLPPGRGSRSGERLQS